MRKRCVYAALVLMVAVSVVAAVPATALAYSPWDTSYTHDELMLMARVIYGEAAGEPYIGKVAVGAVVLNRVRSPLFPDTIAEVIYEPWQFSCVGSWMFNSYPDQDSIRAAKDALAGWDPTGGALYYFNYHIVTNSWLWSKPVARIIGNHLFTY
ncbi:MAG: cell wall hydrolase [Bacillota bacterium]|jgi:N-acetylmuramoyl-L-alanine amidase